MQSALEALKKITVLSFGVFIIIFLNSCASKQYDLNTAQGLFDYAKDFDEAERYEVALQKYAEVRNKFPYSTLATEAELAIADVYFKRDSFSEAEVSYQNFRDLHPKHPKIDYVVFRTGLSFYNQLPETIDRDLSKGVDAIYHFNELLKKYPQSAFAAEAKAKKEEVTFKQAEKEIYIADFYLKQKKFNASLRRYERVLKKFSGLGLDPKALLGASRSALKNDEPNLSKKYSEILKTKYPSSAEALEVSKEGL